MDTDTERQWWERNEEINGTLPIRMTSGRASDDWRQIPRTQMMMIMVCVIRCEDVAPAAGVPHVAAILLR